jgi:hypothetical protein
MKYKEELIKNIKSLNTYKNINRNDKKNKLIERLKLLNPIELQLLREKNNNVNKFILELDNNKKEENNIKKSVIMIVSIPGKYTKEKIDKLFIDTLIHMFEESNAVCLILFTPYKSENILTGICDNMIKRGVIKSYNKTNSLSQSNKKSIIPSYLNLKSRLNKFTSSDENYRLRFCYRYDKKMTIHNEGEKLNRTFKINEFDSENEIASLSYNKQTKNLSIKDGNDVLRIEQTFKLYPGIKIRYLTKNHESIKKIKNIVNNPTNSSLESKLRNNKTLNLIKENLEKNKSQKIFNFRKFRNSFSKPSITGSSVKSQIPLMTF